MKIIVGLGNPGSKYAGTRHNAGFMVIDALAKKHKIVVKKKAFGGIYGIGHIREVETLLFKPQTYMNLSGPAVEDVCSAHLTDKKELLVVSDDLDLPLGKIRLRQEGSSGGHNGLRSIIEVIGKDFGRLKIGVGPAGEEDAAEFVLSEFLPAERDILEGAVEKAVGCVEEWLLN